MSAALGRRVARPGGAVSAGVPRAHASVHGVADKAQHQAGSLSLRDMFDWRPRRGSADSDMRYEIGTIVGRARDLIRNNDLAAGAMQTYRDNVVGTGLRLVATPDYKALGKDKEWAQAFRQQVEGKWRGWADTTACDAADKHNFAELTDLFFMSAFTNGDALGLPLWLPEGAGAGGYSTRISLVESDRLSNPYGMGDTALPLRGMGDTMYMRGGIEINDQGRHLAYNIQSAHPGDIGMMGAMWKWDRIPARTAWGRKRVIFAMASAERIGQTRGKPVLSPVLRRFKTSDRLETAELQAAVVNAMIAAFIKTPLDQESIIELFKDDPTAYGQMRQDYRMDPTMSGASIVPLMPGDELQSFMPNRPSANFEPFVTFLLRQIAAGLNMPYELLVKDFSKTNYSSARAALMEAWRFFRGKRKWLADNFCAVVYTLWLEEVINAGEIDGVSAQDFYAAWPAFSRCRWIGPGRGWIDPVKEALAAEIRIDTNLSTLEIEAAEQGLDWEELLEQIALERATMVKLGLPLPVPLVSSAPLRTTPSKPVDPNAPDPAPGEGDTGDNPPPEQTHGGAARRAMATQLALEGSHAP